MTLRRLLSVLCLFGWMLAAPAPPAHACSCVPVDARDGLVYAEAAFVGALDHVRQAAEGQRIGVFNVEKVVKGDLGAIVEIADDLCFGLGEPGQRLGLLLRRHEGHWGAGCGQVTPDGLLRAAEPFPEPDGEGPAVAVLGSTYGPGRLVSLDRFGRPIAFGEGEGATQALAFCPGGRRFAEVWSPPYEDPVTTPELTLWEADGMRRLWSRPLDWAASGREDAYAEIEGLACVTESGDEVRSISLDRINKPHQEGSNEWRYGTVRVRSLGQTEAGKVLWETEGTHGAITADGRRAFASASPRGLDLTVADLRDPSQVTIRVVAQVPPEVSLLSLSPDGGRVAATAENRPWEMTEGYPIRKLVTVDVASGAVHTRDLTESEHGQMVWADDDTVVRVPSWHEQPVQVFDSDLKLQSSWAGLSSGYVSPLLAADGKLVVAHKGAIRAASPEEGPVHVWAELEDAVPHAMAVAPGAVIDADRAGPLPSSTTSTTTADGTVEVALPTPGGGGGGGLALAVGGGAAVAAAGAAALGWRRRRRPLDLV